MEWMYGITTVYENENGINKDRLGRSLPITIESLRNAGFKKPYLFVDGLSNVDQFIDACTWDPYSVCENIIPRGFPGLRTFGNWILSAWELYIRNPMADRYALFQDDFVTVKNLRSYLEVLPHPPKGYINLMTWGSEHERRPSDDFTGLYRTNQNGRGAVALVFDKPALQTVLTAFHMVYRTGDPSNQQVHPKNKLGWLKKDSCVDGAIVESMKIVGFSEYVHHPGLVQHIGYNSCMGNPTHPISPSFPGEDFDALTFLEQKDG